MASSYTAIFAFAVLLEILTSSAIALPGGITNQESAEEDQAISVTGDDANEVGHGLVSFRRFPVTEGRLADKDGTKRIFILADTGIKRSSGKEYKTYPVLPLYGTENSLDGFSIRDERRSADDVIPMGRRDIDMLRCMIGRVYRPCWQG